MSEWMSYEALLTEGYRQCAKLTRRYGTTYFWGATLLPKPQRKHVHAIYALCRLADDIVDLPNGHHLIKYDLNEVPPDPVEEHESSIGHPSAGPSTDPDSIPTEPEPTLPDP